MLIHWEESKIHCRSWTKAERLLFHDRFQIRLRLDWWAEKLAVYAAFLYEHARGINLADALSGGWQ
jgi:hypothetical protein